MILKRSITGSVSFICLFFLNIAFDLACGPEPDPYDYYISFFHNNIQKTDDYKSFYFNGYTFLNDDTNPVSIKQINAVEWAKYLGGGVQPNDVKHAMYGLKDSVESALYNKFLVYGKLPDSLQKNTFLKRLTIKSKKTALLYYLFSEGLEHITKNLGDQWYPEPLDSAALRKKAEEALNYATNERDNFLKLRYYYQAQRLLHYAGKEDDAIQVYNQHFAKVNSKSHVMGWALSLKAGELQRLGQVKQSAYLFSKVFSDYPELRVQAYNSFRTLKVPEYKVIELAKNSREKGFIYGIGGFNDRHISLATLKKIYTTDPRSPLVSVFLVREINKIEEGYITPKINGSDYYGSIGYYDHDKYDSVKADFIHYIPQLKSFCKRLATEHKYPEPELGYLASAYLSWLQGDTQAGLKALAALKNKTMRIKLFDEGQMIRLLLLSQGTNKLDKTTEARLLPSLTWLDKKVTGENLTRINKPQYWSEYDLKYYSASSRDFYLKLLAPIYFKQKDTVMAALCILRSEKTILTSTVSDIHAQRSGFDMPIFWQTALHSYHFEKILSYDRAQRKTAYLNLLMKEFHQPSVKKVLTWQPAPKDRLKISLSKPEQATIPAIYDLLGTALLREGKYTDAAKAFRHINISKLEESTSGSYDYALSKHYNHYCNPFIDSLHDYPLVYSSKKEKGYNKLLFAETMARLQKQIKMKPKNAAKCYYKMANGLYNTSYFGNAWNYSAFSWTNQEKYQPPMHYYDVDYMRERTAENWFLKACQLSNDSEFKAKCIFMAAKCWQKNIPIPKVMEEKYVALKYDMKVKGNDNGYGRAMINNRYFKELRNKYRKTAFFKIAVGECSYFCDFLDPKVK